MCERSSSADTKVSGERRTGGAPGTRGEIPLQPLVQPMVEQLCLCSPWRSTGMQRSPADQGGDPHQSRWISERGLWAHGNPVLGKAPGSDLWLMEIEAHAGAGFLVPRKSPVTPLGTHSGAGCSWRTAAPEEVTHVVAVHEGVLPMGWKQVQKPMEASLPWEVLTAGAREWFLSLSGNIPCTI